jgi:hypothetical protein
MQSEEKYIELRVAYPGHPHVDVLGLWCPRRGFTRLRNQFYDRHDRFPDGRQEQVHLLPSANLTYEIHEVKNGEPLTWYAATMEDDTTIYRISRQGAEILAKRLMTIRQVIEKFPERPLFEVEQV